MRRSPVVAAAASLVSAAVIVYHNALSAYFFDDDFQWLVGSWSFHPAQLVAFGSLSHFYRPLIDVYFAAATPLFGGSPALFHLAGIMLHAANALVVFALARTVSRAGPAPDFALRATSGKEAGPHDLYGFVAALFFVVQPSDIDAIAWVSAVSEGAGTFFGSLSLLCFLEWLHTARPRWRQLSALAFLLALLSHESSVMFLPVIALADWAFTRGPRRVIQVSGADVPGQVGGAGLPLSAEARRAKAEGPRDTRHIVRIYAPYVVLTLMYLAVDVVVNSRNYVVSQGHYTIGVHVVQNALDYIDALYVGRRDGVNYAVIGIGLALLLLRGSRRVKFATGWMLLALAPFVFFNWANTSRYLYQPAIGFSMLLAEAVVRLDRLLAGRMPGLARATIVAAVVAGITIRFALFAMANVTSFAARTETYRTYIASFREIHGDIPSHTVVPPDPRLDVKLPYRFVNAAVQWEYGDPSIQVTPYEYEP